MRLPSDQPIPAIGVIEPTSGYAIDIPLGDQDTVAFWKENGELVARIEQMRGQHHVVVDDDHLAEKPPQLKETNRRKTASRRREPRKS